MAEGFIQLPVDGSGKQIRTQTNAGVASGAHQEVHTIADSAGIMSNAASGSLTALNQAVTVNVPFFDSTWVVQVLGTFVGTLAFEASVDNVTWYGVTGANVGATITDSLSGTATAPSMWKGNIAGYSHFRARVSAYTSGTMAVIVRTGSGAGVVAVNNGIQTRGTAIAATTGTFTNASAVNSTVMADVSGAGNFTVSVSGTYALAATSDLLFEASDDNGTTWFTYAGNRSDASGLIEWHSGPVVALPANTSRMWEFAAGGITHFRVRLGTATLASGTANIRISQGSLLVEPAPTVMVASGRNVVAKVTASTYRMPGQAASPHNLFAIHNTSASTVNVGIRRLTIQVTSTAASTVLTTFRTWRTVTVPTGGTALTKFAADSGQSSASTVTVLGAASADGTAGTAITHAAVTTTPLWQQFQPIQLGTTGYVFSEDNSLIPNIYDDEPLIIRPGQTVLVAAVTNSLATNHYIVQCMWEEYV